MSGFIFSEEESEMRWKIGYVDCHCGANLPVTVPVDVMMEIGTHARNEMRTKNPIVVHIGKIIEQMGRKLAVG